MKTLTQRQRKSMQLIVILFLVLFLAWFFFLRKVNKQTSFEPKNKTVYIQNSKLVVFDDNYTLNPYPDKVLMHYPYLLVVKGDKPVTTVYNLEKKTKVKVINDILLDYYDGNVVYNRKESYFNDQNLGKFCDLAFIRSSSDILCVTKQNREGLENTLIKINPSQPDLWVETYKPKYLITTLSVINNTIYTGEVDIDSKQNYLSENRETIPVSENVNVIYPFKNEIYFATFKNDINNMSKTSYKFTRTGVFKQNKGEIVLFK